MGGRGGRGSTDGGLVEQSGNCFRCYDGEKSVCVRVYQMAGLAGAPRGGRTACGVEPGTTTPPARECRV